ncbi:hypothetical protein PHMEG_00031336, partial [Phytophthora megakarya]
DEVHPFEIYFMTNWDACKGRWVTCFRQDCPHLGNNTNNRLESGWGKLKPDLNMYMSLDESMSTVITLQLLKEKEYSRQIEDIRSVVNRSYDNEMLHSTRIEFFEERPGNFMMSRNESGQFKYCVNTISWQCSCPFARTRLLPCLHVMYLRRMVSDIVLHYAASKYNVLIMLLDRYLHRKLLSLLKTFTKGGSSDLMQIWLLTSQKLKNRL